MNKRLNLLKLLCVILIVATVVVACTPAAQTPPPSQFSGGGQTTEGVSQEPGAADELGQGGDTGTESGGASAGEGFADDIPLPVGYYDENISQESGQINYKVAGTAEDVVAFYQEKLPEFGWDLAGPKDTAVGNTALMLRKNANGDSLSINMQYNQNGQFTVVTLVVSRE